MGEERAAGAGEAALVQALDALPQRYAKALRSASSAACEVRLSSRSTAAACSGWIQAKTQKTFPQSLGKTGAGPGRKLTRRFFRFITVVRPPDGI